MAKVVNGITIPDFSLEGKVAIVTGGTKGLGFAVSTTLAAFGAKVVVVSRTAADCERVAKSLVDAGYEAYARPTDVLAVENIYALVADAVAKYGKLDIMVNNAGSAVTAKAIDMTEKDWDHVMSLDLKSCIFGAQAAAKQFIAQGTGGRIINIASMLSFFGGFTVPAYAASMCGLVGSKAISSYCAAKAGLINASRALAAEWGKFGITVNCICPGYFKTDINAYMFENEKWVQGICKATAVGHVCELDEITAPIVWLAGNHSGSTTGAYILMDGGTTTHI